MYKRHVPEPVPEENTEVWSCTNNDCNGWMRRDFTFNGEPSCPLCDSSMNQEVRMLPILNLAGGSFSGARS
ncbi:cold-shock protein [Paenibacillus sp. P96]|uniref:Cold-shock protein n=1 Tax=Paenibacillus zeirhizosphaerae TaxID=2987519 RepID=A0ABT9FP08_9BACL|nr:cold-shock protein [Paenibacillus sp. P96]MDP4096236.1 cold-shock protein [Paenibacillus sp. P96]